MCSLGKNSVSLYQHKTINNSLQHMLKIILVCLKKLLKDFYVCSCMILNSELICCFCLIIFPIWDHTQNYMSGYHHTQIIPNNHIIIRCKVYFPSINSSLMIFFPIYLPEISGDELVTPWDISQIL